MNTQYLIYTRFFIRLGKMQCPIQVRNSRQNAIYPFVVSISFHKVSYSCESPSLVLLYLTLALTLKISFKWESYGWPETFADIALLGNCFGGLWTVKVCDAINIYIVYVNNILYKPWQCVVDGSLFFSIFYPFEIGCNYYCWYAFLIFCVWRSIDGSLVDFFF